MSPRTPKKTASARKPWRILVPTKIAPAGLAILKSTRSFKVDFRPGLKGAAFLKALASADAVVIRSEHRLDAKTIAHGKKLRLIARAGVGVENVDLAAAEKRGIVVINTPGANSVAVAELTMALMLALARKIPAADRSVKSGEWNRAAFAGHEIAGKRLGLVGFGRISREVARRALAFEMSVVTYDPFVSEAAAAAAGVGLVTLPTLLKTSDVVSLHLPLTEKTRGLISTAQLRQMKDTALLVNAARGGIIDETALARALHAGKLGGCALDVYETEPPTHRWFVDMDNVITTPHLGASTFEGQTRVGIEIAEGVRQGLVDGVFQNAVNLPVADASLLPRLQPYLALAERMGRLARALGAGACNSLSLELGSQTVRESRLVIASALKGLLEPETDEPITLVNATLIAKLRHLKVAMIDQSSDGKLAETISMKARFGRRKHHVIGVIENGGTLKIRAIDGIPLDIIPEGHALIFTNKDRPGVIGATGAVLGDANINVAAWILGRTKRGGAALAIITVDDPVPVSVTKKLERLPHMGRVAQVDWSGM